MPLAVTPADAPGTGGRSPSPGTVDVWSASLEPPAPLDAHLPGYLSPDERERAERFVFARDRDRFVAGRAFLRLLLAQYLGCEPRALRFRYGPHGKPALADERSDLRFNLAHSGTLAVCALARGSELGVDVERLRPIGDAEAGRPVRVLAPGGGPPRVAARDRAAASLLRGVDPQGGLPQGPRGTASHAPSTAST